MVHRSSSSSPASNAERSEVVASQVGVEALGVRGVQRRIAVAGRDVGLDGGRLGASRARPIAIPITATSSAAPGTSQAVRSNPDFGGSARTSVPYWATSSSLISVLGLSGRDLAADEGSLAVCLGRGGQVERGPADRGT